MWLHSRFMSVWQICHSNTSVNLHYSFHFHICIFRQKKTPIIGLWDPQNPKKIQNNSCSADQQYLQQTVAFLGKPLRSSGALDGTFALVSKDSYNCYNEIMYSKLSVWAFQSGQQTRGWPFQQFCFLSAEQCSHLPQHNLLEQVLSRLGCFFLLTSLHQHPKRSNIEIILLDGSHNMLQTAQQEALSCCQMSNAQQEALSCCQCSKHSYDCKTVKQTRSKLLKQQILI